MAQEDKELLLKDLCTRLPYGVKVNNEIQGDFEVYGFCENYIFARTTTSHVDFRVENIKPYLFPLSSMTDEQQISLTKFVANGINGENILYDWYNKNHFDYRGLIPMGLAIDATGLNIY